MALALGIHVGHDASCALVSDGQLIAAVQQERITRKKYDSEDWLCNSLPINACLRTGGVGINDVDVIVTSFQSASPGGIGLGHPVVAPDFNVFDPCDLRHITLSHHLAHAYSSFFSSGFTNSAILVVDQAGSSTVIGEDYALPFPEWYDQYTSHKGEIAVASECLSIYRADETEFELVYREYGTAHNRNETYVCNAASLYDNVSRFVFRRENCYGQLMALAAFGQQIRGEPLLSLSDFLQIEADHSVHFKNNWQHKLPVGLTPEEYAGLASLCQQAFEAALFAYARRTHALTQCTQLCVAGGAFLNIPANSLIAQKGEFEDYFVPSAPHDAGISVGCAFYGDWHVRPVDQKKAWRRTRPTDRLGVLYHETDIDSALASRAAYVTATRIAIADAAKLLNSGSILARFSGRSEFGPRALGGRSILASPLFSQSKDRLNQIKGRQQWRPVAPIALASRAHEFFDGPLDSRYMSYAHSIHLQHRARLCALYHPDGTTRCQTLERNEDPWLFRLLEEIEAISGYPILVNTSFNARGEPIAESPDDALDMFLRLTDIDAILFDTTLVTRRGCWHREALPRVLRLAPGAILSHVFLDTKGVSLIVSGPQSLEVSKDLAYRLQGSRDIDLEEICKHAGMGSDIAKELFGLASRGILYEID